MYGLIGKMTAVEGQRDALTAILLERIPNLVGCISYVVAHDPGDDSAIYVTEIWTSEDAHRASLQVQAVKDAIYKALPLVATFSDARVTTPVGGMGLG